MLTPGRNCQGCDSCDSRLHSILRGLDPSVLERINRGRTAHEYERGQVLFFEGNPANGIFCVRSGIMKVYKYGTRGRQHILHLAKSGDVLGLETLVGHAIHVNTCEMLQDGVVCLINRQILDDALKEHPGLFKAILNTLASQLRESEQERTELAFGHVRERLALTLLHLASRYGHKTDDGVELSVNLSREDLADMIGATTETTIRQISELRSRNILRTEGRRILIEDPDHLGLIAHVGRNTH